MGRANKRLKLQLKNLEMQRAGIAKKVAERGEKDKKFFLKELESAARSVKGKIHKNKSRH